LRDRATYLAAFGGALALDETHLRTASYGPSGYIERGSEFRDEGNVKKLGESLAALDDALDALLKESPHLRTGLQEPYLSDPPDPGIVGHWRRELAKLDDYNAEIRSHNRLVKKGKRPGPMRTEKVALVWTRTRLMRHDIAIEELAEMLEGVDLYYIPTSQMSEAQARATEHTERQMYAAYQRYRNAGSRHEMAVEHTSKQFMIPADRIETVIEFRRNTSEDECLQAGCDRAPYQQGKCHKHYMRDYRARRSQKIGNGAA
jgi:hypothetical protein